MSKNEKKRWDNEAFRKERSSEAYRDEQKNVPRPPRESYDPTKQKKVGQHGSFPLDRLGNVELVVEFTSYDNGPWQVEASKKGTSRDGVPFSNRPLGRLWPEQAEKLADMLREAALKAREHNGERNK